MLKTIIGDEDFRRGMDLYFERCDGTAATVEDFLRRLRRGDGPRPVPFRPLVRAVRHAAGQGEGPLRSRPRRPTASISRRARRRRPARPKKEPMAIPVAARPRLAGRLARRCGLRPGRPATASSCFDKAADSITFTGVTSLPVPSLFRGFSAPVKVSLDLSDEELLVLLRHDTDAFNRWQAAQTVAMRLLVGSLDRRSRSRTRRSTAFSAALCSFMDRDALRRPRLRGAGPHPSERGRHRAGDRPATWIPDAIHRARTRAAPPHRQRLRRAPAALLRIADRHREPTAPMRRAPAGAPCAMRALDLLAAADPALGESARRGAARIRQQHDRSPRLARACSPPCRAQSRENGHRRVRGALSQRAARARQVVHAAGRDPRGRHPRARAGASWSIPPSRSPIPTACAR